MVTCEAAEAGMHGRVETFGKLTASLGSDCRSFVFARMQEQGLATRPATQLMERMRADLPQRLLER